MAGDGDRRGVLYPTRLPTFHRVEAPAEVEQLVRWCWFPRWDIEPGRSSRQSVLPFPATNLVVEADGIHLSGPTTGISHRDLSGRGWAVGALLRPAVASALPFPVADLVNTEVRYEAPELHAAVMSLMRADSADARERATEVVGSWIAQYFGPPDEPALLANRMEDLIAADRSIVRVDLLADRLALSVRSVQRLAQRSIGLSPLAVIRRYRLQEAAQRLRDSPEVTIGQIAADLGYTDHAHLSADFRSVLGFTPKAYRRTETNE